MARPSDHLRDTEDFRRLTHARDRALLVRPTELCLGKQIPQVVQDAGQDAALRFQDFFASHLRNPNTKQAYLGAVTKFLNWTAAEKLQLAHIDQNAFMLYISAHPGSLATIKQHSAAIRQFLDWMSAEPNVSLPHWNARPVQRKELAKNKHETLPVQDVKRLLESIDTESVVGLRDKTIIALMLSCVGIRVGSIASMLVSDLALCGSGDYFVRYRNRPGNIRQQKMQPSVSQLIANYLTRANLSTQTNAPLFRSVRGRTRQLTSRPMHRTDILRMVKRRARDAEITAPICCDSFRYLGLRATIDPNRIHASKRIQASKTR